MDPLFTAISEHIAFLGYTTPPVQDVPPEIINAVHPYKTPFWVLPLAGGALFRAIYNLSDHAKTDPNAFLTFLNDINTATCLTRYYLAQDYLFTAAWYFGEYDRIRFGIFFDRFLFENTLPYSYSR